ncbi:hypothetical protein BH18THE2_BH18THE2_32720 [soil metagenome]
MKIALTVSSLTSVIMILLLSSFFPFSFNQVQGQSLSQCPVGYVRDSSGVCVPIGSSQSCPVGYQRDVSGFCVPVTGSQFVNPANQIAPQTTFAQPQSSELTSSLVSPTLTNPPAGQLSPWFPSLPAIACGGSSTMTTIGSLEGDSNGDNGDNSKNGNKNDKHDDKDNDDDDDKKEYAFQIESDGGPSADPESVDGTVFAGEKNIERNNGKDFDIKDVFNDCQVSMFND